MSPAAAAVVLSWVAGLFVTVGLALAGVNAVVAAAAGATALVLMRGPGARALGLTKETPR